jgi:hypothetical protein
MSTITYGAPVVTRAQQPARKKWLARLLDAIVATQMRRAEREVRRHRHLLPHELELAGDKLSDRNEDQLPFVR